MGIVFKNNAKTTLGSSLTNSATSATVTDGSVFPSLAAGEFFFCTFDDGTNNEIVKVTARSSNTLTIVRAQESTTARAFSAGDAAELRLTAGVLETIQENIAAKSANQTVFNATTSGGATSYDIGIDPGVEANAMVFLDGVMQHHDTFSFSGSTLTFDAAPVDGTKIEVIVDNLINLQSSNLTVDTFTATSNQTAFTLSDSPAAEANLIVFINGVFQNQAAYTISSNTLTLDTGVVSGRTVTVYVINPVNIGTPSDGTVTSAKLSGNITTPGTLTVGSHDVAFDSPTFVVDNSNSRVGLGTASPSVPVDIVGDVKMSANLTVDTNTLVVNSSTNKVGIGQASPAQALDVVGAIKLSDGILSSGQAGSASVFNEDGTTADFRVESTSNTHMLFVDGGLDRVVINTSSPTQTLDIVGETKMSSHLNLSGNLVATGAPFTISNTSNGNNIDIKTTSSNSLVHAVKIHSGGVFEAKQGAVFNEDSNDVDFRVESNGNTHMLFVDGGNNKIGIGTSSPSNNLEIFTDAGDEGLTIKSTGNTSNALIFDANRSGAGNSIGELQNKWNGTTVSMIASLTGGDTTNKDNGQLKFYTAEDGSSGIQERMVIDDAGLIGIGTSAPTAKLDVRGSVNSEHVVITGASNSGRGLSIQTAASNGQQDAGVVFDAQDTENGANPYIQLKVAGADVAKFSKGSTDKYPTSGGLGGIGGTGANFHLDGDDSEIRMANNIIHSDNSGNTKFTIRAAYGAVATQAELSLDGGHMTLNTGTSFTERIRILGTGEVCIGKTSADFDTRGVHINQTGAIYSGIVGNQAANTYHVRDTTNNTWEFYVTNAGVINATSTSISSLSDVRLKENIKDLETGLDEVIALKPRRFDWKDREEKNVAGFIAQEVEPVLPDLIGDFMHDDLDDAKTVKMSDMIPTLVKAIQEQQEQIETLKTEVQELKDNG